MLEKTEKGNQEGTIKRHWAHKTRDRDKQNKIQQRKLKRWAARTLQKRGDEPICSQRRSSSSL